MRRADELLKLNYGKALQEEKRTPGSVVVYGTNGPCGDHSEALAKGPGLILGRKGMGPLGVEWSPGDYWVIDTAYFVTPADPEVDLRFYYYLIKYIGLNHLKDGTSNPSLSRDTFYMQALPQPPLNEQQGIAAMLSKLDALIANRQEMNRTLESIARALFRSWFVDFDPVRAKMGGRPTGLPDDVAAMFPERMVDSPAGPIPEKWRFQPLKDSCKLVMGSSPSSEFYNQVGEGLPFHQGVTNFGVRFPTHETFTTVTDRTADAGDVLCSVRAPVGRINVANRQLVVGRGLSAIRHNGGAQSFLLYHLFHFFREEDSIGDGTIFKAVTKKDMESIQILSPPADLLAAFEGIANPLDALIRLNEEGSRTLTGLRDTLLPKLLSGEIRVPVGAVA